MWPTQLYTAQQSRDLDLLAIQSGIDGYTLMLRAGEAAFELLLQTWPQPQHLHIVCGGGNNGGDGLVIARLAMLQKIPVTVYLKGDWQQLKGEAKQAYTAAVTAGVNIQSVSNTLPALDKGIIVDALLGTGLQAEVRPDFAALIQGINQSSCPVLAIDLPSGLCSDTGKVLGSAVKADKTITFITAKRGLYTGKGIELCGDRYFTHLAVPADIYAQVGATIQHLKLHNLLTCVPKRPRDAHKGLYGHVLVVGGNHGMAGAALMAAEAATRVGAGLVSVATRPEHVSAMLARHPEVMVHGVISGQELDPVLARPTVIILGPGLGQDSWAEQMVQRVCNTGLPVVVDADALNIISQGRVLTEPLRDNWILTPHPGEAARLLGVSTATIAADRFTAVAQLQKKYGGTVVLKGAGSLVCSASGMALCSYGNPGMASGGMGDVLSGLIGGLCAQGMTLECAAKLAVTLHACAADMAVEKDGMLGLQATDLIPYARGLLNGKY